MSITLAGLALLALQALGEYARQNPGTFHAMVKGAEPGIRETTKQVGDYISGDDYRKAGWEILDSGTKMRIYSLPPGKSITGLSHVVLRFFRQYTGTKTDFTKTPDSDSIVITCVPYGISNAPGAGEMAAGLSQKALGLDIKLTALITEREGDVAVCYYEEVDDDLVRATKAVIGNPVVGLCKLYGINERHQIPFQLNDAIQEYLKS